MSEQEQKAYIMKYLFSIADKDIETLMQAKAHFIKEMAIRKETVSKDNLEILTLGISKILEERIKKEKGLDDDFDTPVLIQNDICGWDAFGDDFDTLIFAGIVFTPSPSKHSYEKPQKKGFSIRSFWKNFKDKRILSKINKTLRKYISIIPTTSVPKTLMTAESLYEQFIDGEDEKENFDYSCIAMQYYKTLETALNELIYKPYAEKTDNDIWKNKNIDISGYFHNPKYYLINRNSSTRPVIKKECELGNISHLLKNAPSKLQEFLKERYNFEEQDIIKIKNFGIKLSGGKKGSGISLYRNNAAHSGIITYAEAKDAKRRIYPSCSKKCNKCSIPDFKCLLTELLGILKF